jgi:hypothetical protein
MIFGSKKHPIHSLLLISSLAIILTGCGGGGSESDSPTGSSTAITQPSSTPVTATSSSAATSTPSSSSSSSPSSIAKSSAAQVSSSSSYVRSSRSSSTAPEFTEEEWIPEPGVQLDLPPSAPDNLLLQAISYNSALIGWQASTDDVALSYYEVRRDGVVIGTSPTQKRNFEDTGLKANTYYTYTVRAIDIAGNRSNFSDALIAKTTNVTSGGTSSSSSKISTNSSSQSSISSPPHSSSSSIANESSSTGSSTASSTSSRNSVRIEWTTPSIRENGEYLELHEIGGYEIRYRPSNSTVYLQEVIMNNNITYYERDDITKDTIFQIAVFDTNGLYSRFIQLTPQ